MPRARQMACAAGMGHLPPQRELSTSGRQGGQQSAPYSSDSLPEIPSETGWLLQCREKKIINLISQRALVVWGDLNAV